MAKGNEGLLKEGFVTTSVDVLVNWSKTGSLWPMSFKATAHGNRNAISRSKRMNRIATR